MFGARIGFSGSADRMALLAVGPDPRWRIQDGGRPPSWKISNAQMVRIAWQKINFTPVLISGIVNGRPFKFYSELSREKYNIQKFGMVIV